MPDDLPAGDEPQAPPPLDAGELETALATRAGDVEAALLAVSPAGRRVGLAELRPLSGIDREKQPSEFAAWIVKYLETFELIDEFSAILRGQHGGPLTPDEIANMQMAPEVGERFFRRTVFARCAIYRGGSFRGSGCLVGPSLVLTCAHVLDARNENDQFADVEVMLATSVRVGTHERPVRMALPAPADTVCPLSKRDLDYGDHDDFALLRMRLPAGSNATTVGLPKPWKPTTDAHIAILHYPKGTEQGVGWANLSSFRKPSARWCYVSPAEAGSSGGPCFNVLGEIVGIHQGRMANASRFVPFERFRERISGDIAHDLAPANLWSIRGLIDGTLVIGRRELFVIFAKMAEPDCGFRTLRIRRLDPSLGPEGLGFSVQLVRELVERRPDGHRALSLAWPQALYDDFDIIDELARVAQLEGLVGPQAAQENDGAATGETGFATAAKGRADRLARALQAAAERAGLTLWIIVEHTSTELGRQTIALETLASLIARWPRLRFVLVGNETVRLPDPDYTLSALDVPDPPVAGILSEFITGFERKEVEEFIDSFHADQFNAPPLPQQRRNWTDDALKGLNPVGSRYPLSDLPTVVKRLRESLRSLVKAP